jgi:hypothetical protein
VIVLPKGDPFALVPAFPSVVMALEAVIVSGPAPRLLNRGKLTNSLQPLDLRL